MTEIEQIIEGRGGFDYLVRSISIVTLLYERGILHEILEQERITEQEIDERAEQIRIKYPGFGDPEPAAAEGVEAEPGEAEQLEAMQNDNYEDEHFEMD